jgi:hypothetical protein
VARALLVGLALALASCAPAPAAVNVFIGSAAIPSAAVDAAVSAPPAQAVAGIPVPFVAAATIVSGPPADGTGDLATPALTSNANVTTPVADATGALRTPTVSDGTNSTPTSANLFVVPSGGTASPTRMSTAADFASATSGSKASSLNAACGAANDGDVVIVRDGSYGGQSINCAKSTSNPVKFYGSRSGVTFSSLSIGNTYTGTSTTGVSIDGFLTNGGLFISGGDTITVSNADVRWTTANNSSIGYVVGALNVTFRDVDFDAQRIHTDVVDVYEQVGELHATNHIYFIDTQIHGGGWTGETQVHPDGLQFCSCANNDLIFADDIQIIRSRLYDSWCTNYRANENSHVLIESSFIGDSVTDPYSACGYSMSTERSGFITLKNNTIFGTVQQTWTPVNDPGVAVYAYNNYIQDVEQGCNTRQWGGTGNIKSHNWIGTISCGGTNLTGNTTAAKIDTTTGVPQAGSPLINAGDTSVFASPDINGATRPIGSAPDIGAYEVG